MREEIVSLEFAPPEPGVWRKYSSNFELPISVLISTFFLTLMFAVLVGLLFLALGSGPEKKVPPISLVDGGNDDVGDGSPGGGGNPNDQVVVKEKPPQSEDDDKLPDPKPELPEVKDIKNSIALDDPTAPDVAVAPENAESYSKLDDELRKKLLNIGGPKGDKPGPGTGNGPPGPGDGGTGSDATRQRSLRWVMRFKTNGGRDYLDQLQALGAVVLVAVPPEKKKMYLFRDLKNPRPGTIASDDDLLQFSKQIQFCDPKRDTANEVGKALNCEFVPSEFWAIFPKGIEDELSSLEKNYRNRRADDIEQTIFQVSVVAGKYRLVVTEQIERLRRR